MIVVDSSLILESLLRQPHAETADRWLRGAESLHAPFFIDLEVAHVLRREWIGGRLAASDGRQLLAFLSRIRIQRHPHEDLLGRIWELRHNLTCYDAAYVALAESLGLPLVTRDAGIARSSGHHAVIEYVG